MSDYKKRCLVSSFWEYPQNSNPYQDGHAAAQGRIGRTYAEKNLEAALIIKRLTAMFCFCCIQYFLKNRQSVLTFPDLTKASSGYIAAACSLQRAYKYAWELHLL
ncbi:MAG TPA: hypothetical protein P5175_05370 [Anaerohalosphaeraceae bacterium]|nr:hypothetical protein [Anaerohalosphaeraceae bacterium]HPC64489.1 hypothetical protein [Anaerohalosphaeraceae bacterium]HRS71265.1 hypothetical protein [Anaerohalosphaeraceae bacterium]